MSCDLFVSYSRRDNEDGRITRLVKSIQDEFLALAGRRLTVFIDGEIRPMEDWRDRILEELSESRLLLACMSKSYVESDYCEWEYSEYVKREIGCSYSAEGVAPVYLEEIPGWGAQDFEDRCFPWVKELRRRQRYDLRSWKGGGDGGAPDAASGGRMLRGLAEAILERITRRERAERNPGNLVDRNPHFIGRTAEMRRLRDRFVEPGAVGMLTAIHGLGGMGKSALAAAYAHRYAEKYGGGRWVVDCAGLDDLSIAIASLQGRGEFDFEFSEAEMADPERRFERVLRELKRLTDANEPRRCLLILDNVDRPELMKPPLIRRLPAARWLHVIATTRFGPDDLPDLELETFLALDELEEEDALVLIEGYQKDRRFPGDAERSAARETVRRLGRFTLAVEAAAVYLSQSHGVTCASFLKRLEAEGLAGLEDASEESGKRVDHGEKSLLATLAPTLEILEPDERLALDYAALLPAGCIPWEWVESLVGDEFHEVEMAAEEGHADRWTILRSRLQSLRLATPGADPDIGCMHRLVQEVVRGQEGFKGGRLRGDLIQHALSRCEALEKDWRDPDLRGELDPLTAWARHLMADDPEHGGTLESALGNLLREMGRFRDAYDLLAHALKAAEGLYGPEGPRVATCMHDLGSVERDLGNHSAAKWLAERALAIDEQAFGPNHPAPGRDCSLLGLVEQDLGNHAVARRLLQRALAIKERALDPNHPELAVSYSNLALVEQDLGNLAEARRLLQRALAIKERAFDPDHPALAVSYSNLATVEHDLGNLAEARGLLQKALAIDEGAFDPNYPALAVMSSNLATVERELGNLAEAKRLLQKALASQERAFDPNHPALAVSYSNLALVEWDLGNLAEAKRLLQRALAIQEQVFDPNHPTLAVSYSYLAAVERDLGNLAEAKRLLQQALAIQERAFDPNHPLFAAMYSYLVTVEHELGNLAEAKRLEDKAAAIRARA